MNTPKLIGLVGYARAGKDSIAKTLLQEHEYWRIGLADPIKAMLMSLLGNLGAPARAPYTDVFYQWFEDHKNDPIHPNISTTIRQALQTLGTEWGRNQIQGDLWVTVAVKRTKKFNGPVVWTDVRFPNEAQAVWNLGGQLWFVDRLQARTMTHESEAHIKELRGECRHTVYNHKDLGHLKNEVEEVLRAASR